MEKIVTVYVSDSQSCPSAMPQLPKNPPARKQQPPPRLVSEETGWEATNAPDEAGQGDGTKVLLATLVQSNQAMTKQMEALTKIVETLFLLRLTNPPWVTVKRQVIPVSVFAALRAPVHPGTMRYIFLSLQFDFQFISIKSWTLCQTRFMICTISRSLLTTIYIKLLPLVLNHETLTSSKFHKFTRLLMVKSLAL